jgi:hypothetical protein
MKDNGQWPRAIDVWGRRPLFGDVSELASRDKAKTCLTSYVRGASAFFVERGHRRFAAFPTALPQGGVIDRQAGAPEHFDAARADINIALWKSYLPEDCVTAMIKNGWHLTV